MRCALKCDKETLFKDQSLCAWGEMQSLKEEPEYREEDIKDKRDIAYFYGFKSGLDEARIDLENLLEDGEVSEEAYSFLRRLFEGELAMQLFIILDHQKEEE